jgi:serine/threonine-protein kinase
MHTDPYKAPAVNVDRPETEPEVPPEILGKIRSAWIAGLVSIVFTLVFIAISLSGTSIMGINAWGLIDVAVMGGLSYGVYRRSRTCAILLLAVFLINKILMWMEAGGPSGWLMALVFFLLFLQGVIGTFQYHRWLARSRAAEGWTPPSS